MQIPALNNQNSPAEIAANKQQAAASRLNGDAAMKPDELKEVFADFVGQTMFGQMIQSMRNTQNPAAYFHGGRAEEIFQGQLDQVLAENISDASASQFADPMFELFMLKRQP